MTSYPEQSLQFEGKHLKKQTTESLESLVVKEFYS